MAKKVSTQKKKSRLKKKLDLEFQIRYTALNPFCLVCGEPTSCMHHYIFKSQSSFLRYDVRNLIPICSRCHTLLHKCGDPRINQEIIRIKGHDWADELERDRRKPFNDTLSNLQEMQRVIC